MGEPRVPPLNPSETIVLSEHYRQSLGQQMLELGCEDATVGKNGLKKAQGIRNSCQVKHLGHLRI